VTITFNEAVTGFIPSSASGGLVITNATDSNPAGSGTTYTVDLTPSGQGEITVRVPENSAEDSSGNGNTESNSFSITYDSVSPTVTIEQASGQSDPTNASPINFTVVFNEPVAGFEEGDVTLGGTAGATTAAVSGSGATYNVAVSGMTTNGTVTASLAAGAAQDAALNTSEASTSTDNQVTYLLGPVDVTIDQAGGQSDPTNTLPVNFTVVFSRAIDPASFTSGDISLSGTAPGTPVVTISEVAPNDGTTFNIAVDGLTASGTLIASLPVNRVQDTAGNNNNASASTDNSITYDAGTPTLSVTNLKPTLFPGPTRLTVEFNEAVYDDPLSDAGADDVTNPANYLLIEKGPNGVSERTTCSTAPPAGSDDVYISIDRVVYDSATYTAALEINGGVALPPGSYVLFACGTTSIVDLAGNPINNGLSDFTYDFRVVAPPSQSESLPQTGFAPGRSTILPLQPDSIGYTITGMVLEIPALGIKQTIVGVPRTTGWDVTWLGNQVGYLNGTAFPTWAGNSVLTGHATNANGGNGPFANLGNLKWGDQIIIHAFGQEYIYEVRTVNRWTNPKDTDVLTRHEDLPWLTLITCNGYDEETGTYRWRTVVRAVQIKVTDQE
jgi:LPXTG-site transpeptidase (sortase) family protein